VAELRSALCQIDAVHRLVLFGEVWRMERVGSSKKTGHFWYDAKKCRFIGELGLLGIDCHDRTDEQGTNRSSESRACTTGVHLLSPIIGSCLGVGTFLEALIFLLLPITCIKSSSPKPKFIHTCHYQNLESKHFVTCS